MNLFLPKNIFSQLIVHSISEASNLNISFSASSLLTKSLLLNTNSVSFIPIFDLLDHNDLFVSKKYGICFDEQLCNSYLYFGEGVNQIEKLFLRGDISKNEVILSKIMMKELYELDVELSIDANNELNNSDNYLIVGDENFSNKKFISNAISFSETIEEYISAPYVNYLLASTDKKQLQLCEEILSRSATEIYSNIDELLTNSYSDLQSEVKDNIREGIGSVIYNLNEADIEGINELLRIPFLHGTIKDIVVPNFV